ncbi:MAG TPA: SDR family oxidoreductase [Solirubrobacteraceae bacterium]|nr:SDR family oxidoreductase [Solirubrobacteraceae bacterium]
MGRLAVIGGSSGIGRAVAERALSAGWPVTVASREPERAPGQAERIVLDVTDGAAVKRAFAALGPVDHLVWTAGASAIGPAREADLDAGRRAFEAKLFGPLIAIRSVEIRDSIVLTSGLAATVPAAGAFFTGTVNGAVEAAVRGLAKELAPVRVNAVAPGMIDTPLYDGLPDGQRQAMFERTGAALPAGRIGRAEDVADAVWHLMTNEFVTGTVMAIDGGSRLVGV